MPAMVRARLILRSPSGGSALDSPDEPATAQTIAEARRRLTGLGFDVAADDPTGLAFQGDQARFEQLFGKPAATPLAVPDELFDVAAGVVIPRSPELFP